MSVSAYFCLCICDVSTGADGVSSLTGAIIIGVTYGLDVKQENDPNVLLAEKAIYSMAMTGVAGTYLGKHLFLCVFVHF